MVIRIPDILSASQVAEFRSLLGEAPWVDGRATAGYQSARVKNNLQVPDDSPVAQRLGEKVLQALAVNPLFMSAALPLKVFPPLFNRYETGASFGAHVDNAIRDARASRQRVRTDLSATLFLSPPDEY